MKYFIVLMCTVLGLLSNPLYVRGELKIVEIYPFPNIGEFEKIIVINTGLDPVSTNNYELLDDSSKKIRFIDLTIPALSYGIATSEAVLNNSGDTVRLIKEGELIDEVQYGSGIRRGESYLYCGEKGWKIVSNEVLEAEEDRCIDKPTTPEIIEDQQLNSLPSIIPHLIPTVAKEISREQKQNIRINEVNVNTTKPDKEWVELYNGNDTEVYLENWHVDDIENGGATPKKFTLRISPLGYGLVYLDSDIFNNDKDDVRILDNNLSEISAISYSSSQKGYTIGYANGQYCLMLPTLNTENGECLQSNQGDLNSGNVVTETKITSNQLVSEAYSERQFSHLGDKEVSTTEISKLDLEKSNYNNLSNYSEFYDIAETNNSIASPTPQRINPIEKGKDGIANSIEMVKSLVLISGGFSGISIISLALKIRYMFMYDI